MPQIDLAVYLVVGVVIVNGIAGRIGVPAPILLVVVGFAVSFVPACATTRWIPSSCSPCCCRRFCTRRRPRRR